MSDSEITDIYIYLMNSNQPEKLYKLLQLMKKYDSYTITEVYATIKNKYFKVRDNAFNNISSTIKELENLVKRQDEYKESISDLQFFESIIKEIERGDSINED